MIPKGRHTSTAAECQSCMTLRKGQSAALLLDLSHFGSENGLNTSCNNRTELQRNTKAWNTTEYM